MTKLEGIEGELDNHLEEREGLKRALFTPDIIAEFAELEKEASSTKLTTRHQQESITLDLEQKLAEFVSFYQAHNIDLPTNFENLVKEIWENNIDEIKKAIQENGFDEMLIIPGNIPLSDLHTKMTDGYNPTSQSSNFISGGSFAGAQSQNVDKIRIVLVLKTQDLMYRLELYKTLNIKGQDVKLDQILTLEDYLVFQRKYFEETGKHLDNNMFWTWLATNSGTRLVYTIWSSLNRRVCVDADDLEYHGEFIGARPSRSFFKR